MSFDFISADGAITSWRDCLTGTRVTIYERERELYGYQATTSTVDRFNAWRVSHHAQQVAQMCADPGKYGFKSVDALRAAHPAPAPVKLSPVLRAAS